MTHDIENLSAEFRAGLRGAAPPSFAHLHDPDLLARLTPVVELDTGEDAEPVEQVKRTRKHRPTLTSVKRQAVRAGIEVARYEVRPDGTIVAVPGTPAAITDTDDTTNIDPKWN